jgi:hypothetical protein
MEDNITITQSKKIVYKMLNKNIQMYALQVGKID